MISCILIPFTKLKSVNHNRFQFKMINPGPMMSYQYGGGAWGNNLTVVDKVTPDMKHLVDVYWAQFPPMNPLWYNILAFFLVVLSIVSCCGNFVVLYVFLTTKALRTPSNMLIVNLAFSDFMIMFTMCPSMFWACLKETWTLGVLGCQLYALSGSLFGCVSIWTMTMISFDRYNVIVKGLSGKPLTMGGVALRLLFIYSTCTFWAIMPLFGWNRYVPEGNMTACGTDYISQDWLSRSYLCAYSFFVYELPLFLIIFSYYHILKTVFAHEKSMRDQAKKMNVTSLRSSEENKTQSTEAKLAKVALMTITLWFMAWTPYLVINWAGMFQLAKITPLFSIWGSVFAKTSCVYNPIVYGISHPKYRAALAKTFPSLVCGQTENDSASTASGSTGDAQSVVSSS
uniref:CSON003862 protein n=1 Tax=Culicoides sonorensis TaxID=179676 RepID=A0A336MTM8_CULSO